MHRRHAHTMDNDGCAWFGQNPSGARVANAIMDSNLLRLFGMPTVQTCGVDIDDERWS